MSLPIRNLHAIDTSGSYIVETNVDIPLRTAPPSIPNDPRLIRANVYRPKGEGRYPVLVTYGPCEMYSTFHFDPVSSRLTHTLNADGKDIHYAKYLTIGNHSFLLGS